MYKLSEVCDLIKGTTGIQKCKPGNYPLVVTAEERLTSEEYQFDCDAVCIPLVSSTGHGHASMKRVHYQSGKFALGNILCAVIPKDSEKLLAEYLYVYFSIFKDDVLVPLMKGAANVSLTVNSLKEVEVPIPDINRQKEIINKYTKIVNSLTEISKKNMKIIEYTEKLKEKILSIAICGELTNNLDAISNVEQQEEKPFKIPNNWVWKKLSEISTINGGYAFKSGELKNEGVRVIRISDFDTEGFVDKKIVRIKYDSSFDPFKICENNILIAMTGGTVGKSLLVPEIDEDMYNNQRVANIKVDDTENVKYIHYVLKSKLIQDVVNANKKSSNDNISMEDIKNFNIPLPTRMEQDIIVEKMEALDFKITKIFELMEDNNIAVNNILKSFLQNCI